MGNCSSSSNSRLALITNNDDDESSSEIKDGDSLLLLPEWDKGAIPWLDGNPGSPYRIYPVKSGTDISPVVLTPPQGRERIVGAEISQPPQSEEPSAVRHIDGIDIASHPILNASEVTLSNDEVKSLARKHKDPSNHVISNISALFGVEPDDSSASPMSVGTRSTSAWASVRDTSVQNIPTEASGNTLTVSTIMGTSPNVHMLSAGSKKSGLRLTESSLINIISIDSKILEDMRHREVSITNSLLRKNKRVQGSNKDEIRLINGKMAPEDHQTKEERAKKPHLCAREHNKMARYALLLLFFFYTTCLSCVGWMGMKAFRSVLILPQANHSGYSFEGETSYLLPEQNEHRETVKMTVPLVPSPDISGNVERCGRHVRVHTLLAKGKEVVQKMRTRFGQKKLPIGKIKNNDSQHERGKKVIEIMSTAFESTESSPMI